MGTRRSDPGARLSVVPAYDPEGEQDAASLLDGSTVVESGASDYALLCTGKIGVEEFMTLTVDRAVAHLVGDLPESQLDAMREVLRTALLEDPHLSALAQRAASA